MKSLRDYRLQAGLTQDQLAEKAGIRVATLSSLENGKSAARKATLTSLAKALKIKAEDLHSAMQQKQSDPKQTIIEKDSPSTAKA